jgi:hypothetical protein
MKKITNDVTLREYFETLILEKEKSSKTALDLAKEELSRRLELLNEHRKETINDRNQFVKSQLFDSKIEGYDIRLRNIDKRLDVIETRSITWTAAVGVFFLILNVVLYFLKK